MCRIQEKTNKQIYHSVVLGCIATRRMLAKLAAMCSSLLANSNTIILNRVPFFKLVYDLKYKCMRMTPFTCGCHRSVRYDFSSSFFCSDDIGKRCPSIKSIIDKNIK